MLPTVLATTRNDLGDADSTVVSLVEDVQRADMHPSTNRAATRHPDSARRLQGIGDMRQCLSGRRTSVGTLLNRAAWYSGLQNQSSFA